MTEADNAADGAERQRILDAALAELAHVGLIEDFTLGRVAARLGVDEIRGQTVLAQHSGPFYRGVDRVGSPRDPDS